MNNLIRLVEEWADIKGLLPGDPIKQYIKLVEEVGELGREVLRNDLQAFRMELGDVMVVLIILAKQNGIALDDALLDAYLKIRNRKGTTVNGTFIKEESK